MIEKIFAEVTPTVEYIDALNDTTLAAMLDEMGPIIETDAFGRMMGRVELLAFREGFKAAVRVMAECMRSGA